MEYFIGQISMYTFAFVPAGMAACDGALLNIQQNNALYSLLGTSFGGDGTRTFALPDLRGVTPMHLDSSQSIVVGSKGGLETVTLKPENLPIHTHAAQVIDANADEKADKQGSNFLWAKAVNGAATVNIATPTFAGVPANTGTIANTGGGGAHNNMQPYLAMNFAIAMTGVYPARP